MEMTNDVCPICRRAFPSYAEVEAHRVRYPDCLVVERGTLGIVPAAQPPVANQPEISQTRSSSHRRNTAAVNTSEVNMAVATPSGGNNVPRDGQPRNEEVSRAERAAPAGEEVAAPAPIEIEGYSLNYITIPLNFFETLETEIVPRGERSPAITNFARAVTRNQNSRMKKLALLTSILLDGSYLFIRLCSTLSLLLAFAYCCMGYHTPSVEYFIVAELLRLGNFFFKQ
ncbi:hypothetical protein EDC94DRAFT_662176 [Helicostylum pulchrum]|nr:hypothetical protein EDC94DRAFT_662176 [Helicostylum pulchrum]